MCTCPIADKAAAEAAAGPSESSCGKSSDNEDRGLLPTEFRQTDCFTDENQVSAVPGQQSVLPGKHPLNSEQSVVS